MNSQSPYYLDNIILTTKHSKSEAIAPPFFNLHSAKVIEFEFDTDVFGTFSGEIERKWDAVDCAKFKCETGIKLTGASYALASEGSFGSHPVIPYLPCGREIMYFIDRQRGFSLHMSLLSEKTNYNMQSVKSIDELYEFAATVSFPSHALIIRPNNRDNNTYIIKGINTIDMLKSAYKDAKNHSINGQIWVETDMRAHMNPTRMRVIRELADALANRLLQLCPQCNNPGWGKVHVENGLECGSCGNATELIKREIYGCAKCDYKANMPPQHNLSKADPENCLYCNP